MSHLPADQCTTCRCGGRCSRSRMNPANPILIVGAGLAGSLLALMLSRRGFAVTVIEKRPDLRKAYEKDHRSINLALSHRGWQALTAVGLADDIQRIALPMYGRMIHSVTGQQQLQPYGKEGEAIFSVPRNKLNELLLDKADEQPNVLIQFEHKLLDFGFDEQICRIANPSGREYTLHPEVIFGADGAFSFTRRKMQEKLLMTCEQTALAPCYKELTIPAGPTGEWLLDPTALHIWPRGQFMMIALPNQDRTFTCTLFMAAEGENSFAAIQTPDDLHRFFVRYFPNTIPLMPTLETDFFRNPTSRIMTMQCFPWHYENKVALIGDAAHAIVPFYGQGMNASFEDCTTLLELIGTKGRPNWAEILPTFQHARKENTDAIAELSLRNFIEMRDKVADPAFVLRKQIEAHIHRQHPDQWTPLYSLVSFSHTPYAEALRISQQQDIIMNRIMGIAGIDSRWQHLDYKQILQRYAVPDAVFDLQPVG
jgi:kynurenine 3-monooxygenase